MNFYIILWSIIIIILIILVSVALFKKSKFKILEEKLESIPKVIHKVFIQNSGEMASFPLEPKELQDAHESWKNMNPEYEIKYYSMNDCREYLKKHFEDTDFLQAFDCLNGYANKCDFFRYCVLYNEGGWYSDWKQVCLKENLLNKLNKDKIDNIVIAWDKGEKFATNNKYIQTCFIGTIKYNLFLKEAINSVINNIKYKYYGKDSLCPTSPGLLGDIYKKLNYKFNIKLVFKHGKIQNGKKILIQHKCDNCGFGQDWKEGNNYNDLWKNKTLYKDFIIKDRIPKIIHKTGPFKENNLPEEIKGLFDKIKNDNPEYEFRYYDDDDCYNLIKNNFEPDILWAYNRLKPTAYKADLFRYCVLYLYGGIYSDLTQDYLVLLNDIIDYEKDTLVLTQDRVIGDYTYPGIQISFICCIPKLEIFKECIKKIINNCKISYYGRTSLDVTGPYLFRNVLNRYNINYITKLYQEDNFYIRYNKNNIIKLRTNNHYKIMYNKKKHYNISWLKNDIYN